VQDKMIAAGLKCKCIRCREVRGGAVGDNRAMLFRQDYDASGGKEIFLSLESADRSTLHSFIRLRVVDKNHTPLFHALDGAALIREIHTYGPVVGIGQKSVGVSQHQGYGMRLLAEAERIANLEFKLSKMAVIAGVGVREYFCKHGYELEDTYMVKKM